MSDKRRFATVRSPAGKALLAYLRANFENIPPDSVLVSIDIRIACDEAVTITSKCFATTPETAAEFLPGEYYRDEKVTGA